jgi:NAD-dependent DNA ligase
MHTDHAAYHQFTSKSRLEKSINSLLGLLDGIIADQHISPAEFAHLRAWLDQHAELRAVHPFNELLPALQHALADGVMTAEEHQDLTWLCDKLRAADYYDAATADMQRLQGMLAAIAADQQITGAELSALRAWIAAHDDLATIWPYDEVVSLVTAVLADGQVDAQEHAQLLDFFASFGDLPDAADPASPARPRVIHGLCAVCPTITFPGRSFCLTGASCRYTRKQFTATIQAAGGRVTSDVSPRLNYLVVGADGNPCWAYSCYGRKVEAAMDYRMLGAPIVIVHENDLHDALADAPVAL